jgi:hypothetical protein
LTKLLLASVFSVALIGTGIGFSNVGSAPAPTGSDEVVACCAGSAEQSGEKADCCKKNLACCDKNKSRACCVATTKNGCCAKGMKCCETNSACCSAVQECCRNGAACCDEGKACCGKMSVN